MVTATAVRPTGCPRCEAQLVVNHDELVCLTHGTVYSPMRAGDNICDENPGKYLIDAIPCKQCGQMVAPHGMGNHASKRHPQ